MMFSTLFASAQAISVFNLLPLTVQNSIEWVTETPVAPGNKVPIPGNTVAQNCQAGRPQMLNITDLTLDPALPVAGQPLTVEASGLLLSNITEGSYVDVMIHYGLVNVIKTRYDLCTYLPEVGYECPTGPGEINFTKTFDLPAAATAGDYLIIAKAFDVAGDMLTCLFADVTISA